MSAVKISVIIVTKNSSTLLEKCLKKINSQEFDHDEVEILVLDGTSTDDTLNKCKENNAIYVDAGYSENQEARRLIGARIAKGKILVYIDTDNFIEDKKWLCKMIEPIIEHGADCSFTKWYGWSEELSFLDRYYALIGGNDPVAYYLGKNDRARYLSEALPAGAQLIKTVNGMDFVGFDIKSMPTIGCNGFVMKSDLIKTLNITDPDLFFHTDIHVDLIKKRSIIYAIVPISITHAAGTTLMQSLKKRLQYKNTHGKEGARRYLVFDINSKKDCINLMKIIVRCLIFLPLIIDATTGYVKSRKKEWLIHPVVTLAMVVSYAIGILKRCIKQIIKL